jgi:hypothetical protein
MLAIISQVIHIVFKVPNTLSMYNKKKHKISIFLNLKMKQW